MLRVLNQDIVRIDNDDKSGLVIVNAANKYMRGGEGVDGAIHAAVGPQLVEELKLIAPNGAKDLECVMTGGYNLSEKILHCVGQNFMSNPNSPIESFVKVYSNVILSSVKAGYFKIASPVISGGIFQGAYTDEQIAKFTIKAINNVIKSLPSDIVENLEFTFYAPTRYNNYKYLLEKEIDLLENENDVNHPDL